MSWLIVGSERIEHIRLPFPGLRLFKFLITNFVLLNFNKLEWYFNREYLWILRVLPVICPVHGFDCFFYFYYVILRISRKTHFCIRYQKVQSWSNNTAICGRWKTCQDCAKSWEGLQQFICSYINPILSTQLVNGKITYFCSKEISISKLAETLELLEVLENFKVAY